MTDIIIDGPEGARWTLALAHGAGAAMDTPFMNWFALALAAQDIRIARFEFPYMAERRRSGRKRPPDRQARLLETWRDVIGVLGPESLLIGGKSMGGRMASLVADEAGVAGLVCLGFPFHAPGRAPGPRIDHLATLATPTLICQGSRDPFGTREDVADYDLAGTIRFHWAEDGDHDLVPRRASGRSREQNWAEAELAIADFIGHLR